MHMSVKCEFSPHALIWRKKITKKPIRSREALPLGKKEHIINQDRSNRKGPAGLGRWLHGPSPAGGGKERETPPRSPVPAAARSLTSIISRDLAVGLLSIPCSVICSLPSRGSFSPGTSSFLCPFFSCPPAANVFAGTVTGPRTCRDLQREWAGSPPAAPASCPLPSGVRQPGH